MKIIYRIETEIKKRPYGALKKLADTIGISSKAVKNIFKNMKAGYGTMAKYTDGFNEAFNTSFTEDYLFEIIEIEDEK